MAIVGANIAAVGPTGEVSAHFLGPATEIIDATGHLGDKIGSLAAGKEADLILIDLNRPHLTPRYDVYSHLVYTAGRDDVATVLIRGRIVMQQRRLTTLGEARSIAAVQELAQQIAE